ncbi:MAG TPA: DUF2339 domain-containing protein [Cryomorphaceae bacterium]|nr:DUF2339 domain-containing protein [Cryomorphaceae bacterium]
MEEDSESVKVLIARLDVLIKKQADFFKEVEILKSEIDQLRYGSERKTSEQPKQVVSHEPEVVSEPRQHKETTAERELTERRKFAEVRSKRPSRKGPKSKSDLEKFIGENLISKIGIAITIIGVAIGAKYSIEHDLINPLTRIILGYIAGLGLLGFGIKLKKNYTNYSAVLVSGAIAIMYFITFAAYDFYFLIPQLPAFALMVIFTAFGVVAAISYNQQVIAHIGLVGAYSVPFLLSDGSGKVATLYAYMAIINIGILAISFQRYWKAMYYSAFGLSWLIYLGWFVTDYSNADYFQVALIFATVFFLIFYATFLAYKLLRKEEFKSTDVALLLINSFIFYGLGYAILSDNETGKHLLGAFTLANAVFHFGVAILIYRQKNIDQKLSNFITGLVLVFITIAIPVQLDGGWVTLLWTGQATLLFWLGRTKKTPFYERLSYPLMALAFVSLNHDWATSYHNYYGASDHLSVTPVFNVHFLTSLLFIAAFSFINFVKLQTVSGDIPYKRNLQNFISFAIPAALLYAMYFSIYLEISNYWTQLFIDSQIELNEAPSEYGYRASNSDLLKFKSIWIINYTMLFLTALAFANFKKIKSQVLGVANMIFIAFAMFYFLTSGLYVLSELRENYLAQHLSEYYNIGIYHIAIRYISIAFFALMMFTGYKYLKQNFMKFDLRTVFNILLHASVLWILSSELIHLLEMAGSSNSYKLGLTILWGIYALFMISLGISRSRKYLRIAAFVVLGITLVKLFFYDISNLDTIAKTIVFVSIGILLLIISFLYNKYKQIISNEPKE